MSPRPLVTFIRSISMEVKNLFGLFSRENGRREIGGSYRQHFPRVGCKERRPLVVSVRPGEMGKLVRCLDADSEDLFERK